MGGLAAPERTHGGHGGSSSAERFSSGMSAEHTPKKVDDEPLKIVLTGLDSNVDLFAKEAAHEALSEQPEAESFKRFVKNVWNNITHEYRAVKQTQAAREEIYASGNLLHHHGKSDQKWREAVVTRYSSEYGESLLREGETFHNLNSPEMAGNHNAQRIRDDILNRVRQYARGDIMDPASLEEAHGRDREEWAKDDISQEFIGEGKFLAHNILAMAEQAKAAYESTKGVDAIDRDAKLEEMLSKAEIITGEAKVGSQVEIESTLSERLAEKLKNVPFINEGRLSKIVGFLGNETAVAALLSVASYGAKSAFSRFVIPGVGGGIVAAVRERKMLKQERALMARRMDYGAVTPDKVEWGDMSGKERAMDVMGYGPNSRQAKLGEVMDNARPVEELMAEIGGLYDGSGELKMRTRGDLADALSRLAEVQSRSETTDDGRRLVGFENHDVEDHENLRWDLVLAAAKLETDMQKLFENPVAKAMLDIKDGETFEAMSAEQRGLADGVIEGEMEQKDKLFNKVVAKEVFSKFVGGTVLGVAVGGVVHGAAGAVMSNDINPAEVLQDAQDHDVQNMAFAQSAPNTPIDQLGSDGSPSQLGSDGAPDQLGSPGDSAPDQLGGTDSNAPGSLGGETTAPSAPDTIGGSAGPEQLGTDAVGGEAHALSESSTMNLPEGYGAEVNGDQLTVTTPDGSTIEGLQLNSDGSLTDQAKEALQNNGLNVADTVDVVNGEPQVSQQEVPSDVFAQNHMDEMKTIHHQGWMDEGGNELKTNNGVDANGNIIIDVSGMAENGSFHGASGINWHEAALDGHLTVDVSAGEGSQAHVFEVPISPNGQAIITPDNPAYALYDANGTPTGGFQEINFNAGMGTNGAENVVTLSTVVGSHQESFTDTITTQGAPEAHHSYIITDTNPAHYNIEPTFGTPTTPNAPVLPTMSFYDRERLGKATKTTPATPTSGGPTGGGASTGGTGGASTSTGSSPGGAYRYGPGSVPSFSVNPDTGSSSESGPSAFNGGISASNPNADPGANSGSNPNVGANGNPNAVPDFGLNAADPNTAGQGKPDVDQAAAGTETGSKTNPESNDKTAEYAKLNEEDRKFMADLDNEVTANGETLSGDFDFPGFRADFKGRERVMAGRFMKQASTELGASSDNATIAARALDLAKAAVGSASGELSPLFQKAVDALERSVAQIQKRADREKKSKEKGGAGAGEAYLNDLDSETGRFPFSYSVDVKSVSPEIQKLITRIYRDAKAQVLTDKGPAPPLGTGDRNDPRTKEYNDYMRRVFRTAVLRSHPDQYERLSDSQKAMFNDAMRVLTQAQAAYR